MQPVEHTEYSEKSPSKALLFLVSFLFGLVIGGMSVALLLPNFTAMMPGKSSNPDSSYDEEISFSDTEEPENLVYRNDIYGIAFLYPSQAYSEFKEYTYSEYGEDLGRDIPYQYVTLALDGSVSLEVWNVSELPRFRQGNPAAKQINAAGFSEAELAELIENESNYFFLSNDYFIKISVDITRKDDSILGKTFLESFRIIDYPGEVNTEYWLSYSTPEFSFSYPQDWSVSEDEAGNVQIYQILKSEQTQEGMMIESMGLVSDQVLSLSYTNEDLDSLLEEISTAWESYVKSDTTRIFDTAALRSMQVCNQGGEYDRGAVLERGERCIWGYLITSPTEEGFIEISNYSNSDFIVPTTELSVLQTVSFN